MINTIIVVAYLAIWLMLRLTALRFSKAVLVRRGSPWITRLVLVYCFVISVGFVAANTWLEWDIYHENFVRLVMGISTVSLALVCDTICLLSLGSFYSLEMGIKKNHAVIKSGLYRFVRHPLYLSNIIGFLGLCILINHWAAWVALPAQVFALYLMAKEEELFLISHLGKKYERYREDVQWMLVPGIL